MDDGRDLQGFLTPERVRGHFDRAVAYWNAGAFFEAHEDWEALWQEAEGGHRTWLQGLIQWAAAFHHVERGTSSGFVKLARSAAQKLAGYAGDTHGIDVAALGGGARALARARGARGVGRGDARAPARAPDDPLPTGRRPPCRSRPRPSGRTTTTTERRRRRRRLVTTDAVPPRPLAAVRRALRRFFRDLPAVVVAVHVAGLLGAHQGLPERGLALAAIAFAAVLVVLLLATRAVWSRPRWRRVAMVLLAAHVVFWTARGLLHARLRDAGPVVADTATVWQGPPQPFLAGVGVADFALEDRDTLAGYGAAPRRMAFPWLAPGPLARASLADLAAGAATGAPRVPMFRRGTKGPMPLGARALVLRPAGSGPEVAIVRLDLVMCDARLRDAIRQRVADLGIVDDTLVVCATHTHSGPGGFACAALAQIVATDHLRPDVVERVVGAARGRGPARPRVGGARDASASCTRATPGPAGRRCSP